MFQPNQSSMTGGMIEQVCDRPN